MSFPLKKASVYLLCAAFAMLAVFSPIDQAQASSPITVTISPPSTVTVNEQFVVSVTIAAATTNTATTTISSVEAMLYSPGIIIESQMNVNRQLSAGERTTVNLMGTAFEPGLHRVQIEVHLEASPSLAFSEEIIIRATGAATPPSQAARPRFEIPRVSFAPERPDISRPFTLNVILRNIGNETARDIVASFDGGENFAVTTLTNRVNISTAERGQEIVTSFQIRARDTHKSNEVTLTLTYGEYTQTERLNLPLPDKEDAPDKLPPLLRVSSFNLEPFEENRLLLSLNIENIGELLARSVSVSLNGGERVFPLDSGGIRRISSIAAGSNVKLQYLLSPKGELVNYPLEITFNFKNPDGESLEGSERIFISSNLEPSLKITGFNVRPQHGEGNFLLDLVIQNKGFSTARNVTARFTGTQAFPLEGSNLIIIPDLSQGASASLTLPMKAAQPEKTYAIPIELSYRSAGGYEHKASEIITLTAESIGIDPEEDEEKKGTPRVMLERHTLSEEQIFAGSTFTLALYIRNNAERSVGNMKISLESIQVPATGTGGGGGGSGGTVFSPLDGSSSSFFVDEIAAKAQLVKEVTLFVDPNAAAMTYTLPISLEFEDEDGNTFSVNESVNIPVLQETRMQVLSVDIPKSAAAGQPVPLSMEFANTGRIALNNVFVEIVGDFPKENATYFVPRLEIGMSDFFQGMIIPAEEGTISGSLVLTYLDALNQEVKIEHPFTLTVEPMMDMPVDMPLEPMPGFENPQAGLPWMMIAIVGGGALLLLVAAIFIVKKIKAKRQNDFFNEKA